MAFTEMLPTTTENQSKYDEIPLDNVRDEQSNFGGVYSYSCSNGKTAPDAEHDEIMIVKIIRRLVDNPAYTVQEKDDVSPRSICYRDFMLITPSKAKLGDYMKAFVDYRIPFYVEGKVEFGGCPSLTALSKVLKAIAYPNALSALYGALTSDIFRVTKGRLYTLKNKGVRLGVFADVAEADAEIANIFNIIKDFVLRSQNMPMSVLFGTVYDELRVIEKTGTENLEYLYYALELIRNAEVSGKIASLQDGSDYLEELLSGKSGIERAISLKEDSNRVHIANLHKVKGLEAPIVLLAGRTTRKMGADRRTEQNGGSPTTHIFNIKGIKTEKFPDEKQKEDDCLAAEKVRLLYVAATRTRRALIIGFELSSKGETMESNAWMPFLKYCQGDFFSIFTEKNTVVFPHAESVDPTELIAESEKNDILKTTDSFKKSYEIIRPSTIRLKSTISSEDDFEDSEDSEARANTVRKNTAIVGTMVHRLMEMLVTSKNNIDVEEAILDIVREYIYGSGKYVVMLKEVADKIRNGGYEQTTDVPKDILAELLDAEEVHCELPFCYKKDSKLWHGVIDVLYRKDGKWHIIDYKTNAEAEELDEKYGNQLDAYIAAVKEITGEDADAKIYHIEV